MQLRSIVQRQHRSEAATQRAKQRSQREISRNVSVARSNDVARIRASPLSVSWYICSGIFPGSAAECSPISRKRARAQGRSGAWRSPEHPCQASINCRCCTRFPRQDRPATATSRLLRCENGISGREAAPTEHSLTRAGKSCVLHRSVQEWALNPGRLARSAVGNAIEQERRVERKVLWCQRRQDLVSPALREHTNTQAGTATSQRHLRYAAASP